VAVTIASIPGEFAAFVLGILMEVNIAQIDFEISWGSVEINAVTSGDSINIAWRLRAKAVTLGILCEIVSLFDNYFIRNLIVITGTRVCCSSIE